MIVATTRLKLCSAIQGCRSPKTAYQNLIGKEVIIPFANRRILSLCERKTRLRTGCLKITPAHDPADYEIGKRHGLATINILTDPRQ